MSRTFAEIGLLQEKDIICFPMRLFHAEVEKTNHAPLHDPAIHRLHRVDPLYGPERGF